MSNRVLTDFTMRWTGSTTPPVSLEESSATWKLTIALQRRSPVPQKTPVRDQDPSEGRVDRSRGSGAVKSAYLPACIPARSSAPCPARLPADAQKRGAQERIRTSTTLRSLDPESSASASSATWATVGTKLEAKTKSFCSRRWPLSTNRGDRRMCSRQQGFRINCCRRRQPAAPESPARFGFSS